MGATDQIRRYRAGCAPDVCRLRMLERDLAYADEPLTPLAAQEITRAMASIVAQSQAGYRVALAAVGGGIHDPGNPSLLRTRLARLKAAAAAAAAAAGEGDVASLRRHLWRFDALATAIWTVLYAVVPVGQEAGEQHAGSGRLRGPQRNS